MIFVAFLLVISLSGTGALSAQAVVNNLESYLKVDFWVIDNTDPVGDLGNQWLGHIDLTYMGDDSMTDTNWVIYFCSIRLLEYDSLRLGTNYSVELGTSRIYASHIDGCLHKLEPADDFLGFESNRRVQLPFQAADWHCTRTDGMPSSYVTSKDGSAEAKIITSTAGESLDFVADFVTEKQWKRRAEDLYNPFTPEQRFDLTGVEDAGEVRKQVIPTPVSFTSGNSRMPINTGDWVVTYASDAVKKESEWLADKLGIVAVPAAERPSSRYIELASIPDTIPPTDNTEAYTLSASVDTETVLITGNSAAGAFYGVQSLLSLAYLDGTIPECEIIDYPRFPYRGMHTDVSRNFHSKEEILTLLEVMAMYKLNKFYFHLTDDEGWRLEIPSIPELTEVGAKRCHDLDEQNCILPQLGSGPTSTSSGSGYYSVDDYKEILQFAADRHIEVIPEFDMPGHAHAPIRAMEARGTPDYLLSDPNDKSDYLSVQMFRYNAMNPCLQTTYDFVAKVIDDVKAMHTDIQPLRLFNFGGDETPHGAWEGSPLCETYTADNNINLTNKALKEHFVRRVGDLADQQGLQFGGWEDGIMDGMEPYNRSQFAQENVVGWAWNNIWEWGSGNRAYILANAGYQVVLSHATHLYFDHPHEPDPEERGFYWATRYTDASKTFGYMPDDVYKNIDVSNFGVPLDDFCVENHCVPLEESKRQNIIGMQGHLWSETVRTPQQLHEMIFPRLVALAERAWHKADWEELDDYESGQSDDWYDFANTMGYKELMRLDEMGVTYGIPPPGAKIHDDSSLEVSTMYPGLTVQYSIDGGSTWNDYARPVKLDSDTEVTIVTRSADRRRTSRAVIIQTQNAAAAAMLSKYSVLTCVLCILYMLSLQK